MSDKNKNYFDVIAYIFITIFTIVSVVGLIVFLSVGLTIGIPNIENEEIVPFGMGMFMPVIAISLPTTLFLAWRYWRFDEDGVSNGNLFRERKFSFKEIDRVEIKIQAVSGRPFVISQEQLCFYKGKKMVAIPTFCLTEEEKEWLINQVNNKR